MVQNASSQKSVSPNDASVGLGVQLLSRNRPGEHFLGEERSLAPWGCALLSPRRALTFAVLSLLVLWCVRPPRPLPNPSHSPRGGCSPCFVSRRPKRCCPSLVSLAKQCACWRMAVPCTDPSAADNTPPPLVSHTGTSEERSRDKARSHRWTSTQLGREASTSMPDSS